MRRPLPTVPPLRVADVMTTEAITVSPTTTLAEAMTVFTEYDLRHLLVVAPCGRFAGVLSDRDVLRRLACGSADEQTPVSAALHEAPVTVSEDTLVVQAIDILRVRHFHALPVVDGGGRLQGVVTTMDLLGALHDVLLGLTAPGAPHPLFAS